MAAPVRQVVSWIRECKTNNSYYNAGLIFLQLRHAHASRNAETAAFGYADEQKQAPDAISAKIGVWMKLYEDLIGISEIKAAQNNVITIEAKLLENQESRRQLQAQTQVVRKRLKEISLELDKTLRGEDRYLQLLTQEYAVLQDEQRLNDELNLQDKAERDYFMMLSSAVRDSHERQRHYTEKTKYWSIIGSVGGTIIGIFGANLNRRQRIREMQDAVLQQSEAQSDTQIRKIYSLVQEAMTAKNQPEHESGVLQELAKIRELLATRQNNGVVADIKEALRTHKFFEKPEAGDVGKGKLGTSFSKVLWGGSAVLSIFIIAKVMGF